MSARLISRIRWGLYISTLVCLSLYFYLPKSEYLWTPKLRVIGMLCFLLQGPFMYLEQSQSRKSSNSRISQ